MFTLFEIAASGARRNPVPHADVKMVLEQYYVMKRKKLEATAKEVFGPSNWENGLQIVSIRAIELVKDAHPLLAVRQAKNKGAPDDRTDIMYTESEWEEIFKPIFVNVRNMLSKQKKHRDKWIVDITDSEATETAPKDLRLTRAEAKKAIEEAEGEVDSFAAHRSGSKEMAEVRMRRTLSYIHTLPTREQALLLIANAGAFEAILLEDSLRLGALITQLEKMLEGYLPGSLQQDAEKELLDKLEQREEIEKMQKLVRSVNDPANGRRDPRWPPGDVDMALLRQKYPDAEDTVRSAMNRLREAFYAKENRGGATWPLGRSARPARYGRRFY